MKRIEARRKLWSPYLQMLAGTRYELAFRRAVSQAARPAGQDRRAPGNASGCPAATAPPLRRTRAGSRSPAGAAALAAAHERS